MPAMNDEMPKPTSLVPRTSIPAAAAARSFERTASMRWPRSLRRRFATTMPRATAVMTQTKPKTGLGGELALIGKLALVPRSIPKSRGDETGAPATPPPIVGFAKMNFSIATAPASVTIARLTPRTRNAETATTSPTTVAIAAPISGPNGKPIPRCTASFETVNAETPASAICAIETWPTKPIVTTSERHTITPITELISAWRKSNGKTSSAAQPARPSRSPGASTRRRAGRSREASLGEHAALGQVTAAQVHRDDDDDEVDELRHAGIGSDEAVGNQGFTEK